MPELAMLSKSHHHPIGRYIETDRKKQLWIITTAAFAGFLSTLNTYIVNISLPAIGHYFNVSTAITAWVPLSYLLVLTCTLLIFGKLGDTHGIKKFFIAGFIVIAIGAALSGFAPSMPLLIAARCVQALGAAAIVALAPAMIPKYLPEDKRGWAYGIFATVVGLGIMLGAPLGGFITGTFSWQWIFFVNIPLCIVFAIIAAVIIPPDKPAPSVDSSDTAESSQQAPQKRASFDILGSLLVFVSLSSFIYAINSGRELGWFSPIILGLFALTIVALVLFIFQERRASDPLLDLQLFTNSNLNFGFLSSIFFAIMLAGNSFIMPFYLTMSQKLPVQQAGLVLIVYSGIFMLCSPWFGKLSDRIHPRNLCAGGMLLAVGAYLLFVFTIKFQGLAPVIIFLVLYALAIAMFSSPNSSLVMALVPHDRQAIGSSVLRGTVNLGQVIGVGLFETIFSVSLHSGSSETITGTKMACLDASCLNPAFVHVFLFAAFVSFIAFAFSMRIKVEEKKEEAAPDASEAESSPV